MKRTALCLALLAATAAQAEPGFNTGSAVVLHVTSRHINSPEPMNEHNPGLGLRYGLGGWFAHGGTYRNSRDNQSLYLGVGRTLWTGGPFALSVLAGGITGYEVSVTPALLPELSIHYRDAAALLSYVPHIKSGDIDVVSAVSLSFAVQF